LRLLAIASNRSRSPQYEHFLVKGKADSLR
jgi:hypothetical protein